MKDDRRLLALALGSFHATLLTLLLALPFYLVGDLGASLAKLNTAIGLATFGALWATSVYCAYRGLNEANLDPAERWAGDRVLRAGETWGAWNGMLFFWCLLAAGFLAVLMDSIDDGIEAVGAALFFGFAAFAVGTVLAALIGAFFGAMAAFLELGLLRIARALEA